MRLVLASTSAARRAMLAAAGVDAELAAPNVDEGEIKESLGAVGARPRDIADALAEAKAVKISRRVPQALVLGADQLLVAADGRMFDKPASLAEAAAQLRALAGATHRLVTAAVVAEGGAPVWRALGVATLTMRPLSDAFIAGYLAAEDEAVLGCVGAYRLEGRGAQLFTRVEGDFFTVLGLPLLAVLDYLRVRGVLAA